MANAGAAWRGWFPVGGELTSGRTRPQGGLYFGARTSADTSPGAVAHVPLHGPNLFPADPAELGPRGARMARRDCDRVADAVMRGIALGLGLPPTWFDEHLTADPTVLFRIFHYPPGDRTPTSGASASTPTTACSRCSPRTTAVGSRCTVSTAGSTCPPEPGVSSATSATCSND